MENLSFSNNLERETMSFMDDSAHESTEGYMRRIVPAPSSTYSAIGLLDRLSVYASVFGCSATCNA